MAKITFEGPNDLMEVLDYIAFDKNFGRESLSYLENSNAPSKLVRAIKKNSGINFGNLMVLMDNIGDLIQYLIDNGEKPEMVHHTGSRYVYLPTCDEYELVEVLIRQFKDKIDDINNKAEHDINADKYNTGLINDMINDLGDTMIKWLARKGINIDRDYLLDELWKHMEYNDYDYDDPYEDYGEDL